MAADLGIDENRYTRYERAEVEPDLTLIAQMCTLLEVDAGELLGMTKLGATAGPVGGLADSAQSPFVAQAGAGPDALARREALWAFALMVADIEERLIAQQRDRTADEPAAIKRAAAHFEALTQDPFGATATLVRQLDFQRLTPQEREQVAKAARSLSVAPSGPSYENAGEPSGEPLEDVAPKPKTATRLSKVAPFQDDLSDCTV